MAEETRRAKGQHFGLRDVPGTTLALTSLAILGVAAVVTTPLWLWYRRKRKRTDELLRQARASAPPDEFPPSQVEPSARSDD